MSPSLRVAAIAALAVALSGPALSRPAQPHAAPARAARGATIEIRSMAFMAPPANLHVGDTVEWVNNDMFQHSVTDRAHGFDFDLRAGARARIVLRRAGAIAYFCRYHPSMTGTLTVQP